jgi:hypothetical protein
VIPSTLGLEPHAQPWERELVDVESINGATSRMLVQGVREVRAQALRGKLLATHAHVVLGPAGSGKTHLFGRLRKQLGPRAVLVHVRPLIGNNLTPRYLLGQVFGQLRCESYGVAQCDALVGSLLAAFLSTDVEKPRLALEDHRLRDSNERHRLVERIIEATITQHPFLDEVALRALLELPVLPLLFRTAWLNWLGGYELDPVQSARVGMTGAISDDRVLGILRTLSTLASATAPLLLVFDQLENLVDADEGDARVRAYGNLIAELVDTVPAMVIGQMAVDSDWAREIEPRLGQAQRSRVLGSRHLLGLPNREECGALLERWTERLADRDAPYPWPFSEAQVERWCNQVGMTPRMLLLAAERALTDTSQEMPGPSAALDDDTRAAQDAEIGVDRDDVIAKAWQNLLTAATAQIDDAEQMQRGPDPEHLLDGATLLLTLFARQPYQALPRGQIEIAGKLRLSFLHETDPRSLAARFRRLTEARERWLLLREQWRDFRPTWRAVRELFAELAANGRVSLEWVTRRDIASLLALRAIVMQARSSDLTDDHGQPITVEDLRGWLESSVSPLHWEIGQTLTTALERAKEPLARLSTLASAPNQPSDGGDIAAAHPRFPSSAMGVLEELRVASLERLLREAQLRDPAATRGVVLSELESASNRIRWFGRAIVALDEEPFP